MAVTDAPATIGGYRILGKIGEGGMGAVYLAEHVLLGRRAAVKVLRPSRTGGDTEKRFLNEARAISRLSDPGIVQIYDYGHDSDGRAFLVMELLVGQDMNHRLREIQRFDLAASLGFSRQICCALDVAHRAGIVHRDLKPANVFLTGAPERIKLLDFGVAKLLGDYPDKPNTQAGMLMGTPAYMSPEQCRAASDIDARSDIYAVGCVMFAMLTGRSPFHGRPHGEIVTAHVREPPPLASSRRPDLPAVIDEILQRCLAKSPADRFASAEALAAALEAAEHALVATAHDVVPQRSTEASTIVDLAVALDADAPAIAGAGHALAGAPPRPTEASTVAERVATRDAAPPAIVAVTRDLAVAPQSPTEVMMVGERIAAHDGAGTSMVVERVATRDAAEHAVVADEQGIAAAAPQHPTEASTVAQGIAAAAPPHPTEASTVARRGALWPSSTAPGLPRIRALRWIAVAGAVALAVGVTAGAIAATRDGDPRPADGIARGELIAPPPSAAPPAVAVPPAAPPTPSSSAAPPAAGARTPNPVGVPPVDAPTPVPTSRPAAANTRTPDEPGAAHSPDPSAGASPGHRVTRGPLSVPHPGKQHAPPTRTTEHPPTAPVRTTTHTFIWQQTDRED